MALSFGRLEVPLSLQPMEAVPVDHLPEKAGWLLEPKYDGFRAVLFRDGDAIDLRSRRQRPLSRYFPEVLAAAGALPVLRYVLDGELIIPNQPFDTLQLRLHPAASRVVRLSRQHPAQFVAFDLLADEKGHSLLREPFNQRRAKLEAFFDRIHGAPSFVLSKATTSPRTARTWLKRLGHGLDGIVAKRLDLPYQPGQRAMQKFKLWQTIDCVVGGVYYREGTRSLEYLLMGLYDAEGRLHYIGRCGVGERSGEMTRLVSPLLGGGGFTGAMPGGRSRWTTRERHAVPLHPRLVAEVSADHIEDNRFRHGARFIRWREDKTPESCTMDQLASHGGAAA